MKAKTVVAVRERESYTLVNKSEAFLACIRNSFKVYVIFGGYKLNRYKYNEIAFLSMLNISRYA